MSGKREIDIDNMKLLITGVPGTGKTTIGDYLQTVEGYKHFDIEAILKKFGIVGIKMLEEFIKEPYEKKDIVKLIFKKISNI